ncbi:amino acid adenylation domain-containing protein [Nocardia sp. IBHARD005]|uniref:amino acid adenylation domain-containing protein n=1 Tax=Nocardia sp. IBHARD005 TaxID=3457765 RepID=UPI00405A1639
MNASATPIGNGGAARSRSTRPFPLSSGQADIWTAQRLAPEIPLAVAHYVEIHGELDIALLDRAARQCAVETQSPYLRMAGCGDQPGQIVDLDAPFELEQLDVRDADDPRAAAHAWMRTDSCAPIDLGRDRLIRLVLLRTGDTEIFWYCRMHHIAIDGYGATILIVRTAELYNAALAGVEPGSAKAADLYDIYEAELAYRRSEHFTEDQRYWRDRFPVPPMPFGLSTRTAPASAHRIVESAGLDAVTRGLCDAAKQRDGVSRPALLVAALAGYLAGVTGRDEVLFSLPVAARTTEPLRTSAGFVSNVVPLRVLVDAQGPVRELVGQVREQLSAALAHQCYRHEDIRRDWGSTAGRRGFYGPMINMMLFPNELRLGSAVATVHVLSTGPVEDLSINVYNAADGGLTLDFEANPDRYSADDVAVHHRRFLGYLARFLAVGTADAVATVAISDDAERRQLLEGWQGTAVDLVPSTLPELFAAQVARTPDAVALSFDGRGVTYAELDAGSNRLARVLIDAGAGPESIVALAIPRCLELVVGMYAIVKTGAAYLPVDPEHPAERTEYLLAAANPVCVLTVSRHPVQLPAHLRQLEIDHLERSGVGAAESRASSAPITDADRRLRLRPDHPAYLIFTSGSTGKPNGVAVTHAAIDNRLRWMQDRYRLGADDVVVQKSPAGFDVSVWEFFWPLQVGARLVLAAPGGHRDPAYLRTLFAHEGVTTAHFVPSMLAVFVADRPTRASALRRVLCSGEALPAETVRLFRAAYPGVELHNLYGPTEAAVDVTSWECEGDATVVPIGAPVWNTPVYVLDAELRPVPVGAAGELYLAGVQLARGYLGRPALTAGRFVANPFGPGMRLYRTGDLARRRGDGNLEYLGRTDFLVKVRGLRIELGEIESALVAHDSITQAVCLARPTAHGGDELVGYVVAATGQTVDVRAVRVALGRTLPEYMVPRTVVVLDAMPLGPNGKIDRDALPAPRYETQASARAPRTEVEHLLLEVFADVLGRADAKLGIDDGFFDVGGDSLVAARAVARINAALPHAGIALGDLFEAPTVADLAARLGVKSTNGDGPGALSLLSYARAQARPAVLPLSYAQQRLWFLNRFDRCSAMYNMPLAIRLTGALEPAVLHAALADVVRRHESLRTTFVDSGDANPSQVIGSAADAAARLVDELTAVAVAPEDIDAQLVADASTGFDLAVEPPIRVALYRTQPREHVLTVVLHHIACDGWSFEPLARDLVTAFDARRRGVAPDWSPLPVHYADYALWQRDTLGSADEPDSAMRRQLDYWSTTLADLPEQLDLPTDRSRPRVPSHRGGTHAFGIDADTRRGMAELAADSGASVFMVAHAALAILLARLSVTTDVVIGTPIAGRGEAALDELVGMFVNTVVLRTEIDPSAGFDTVLGQIRDRDLDAFANAGIPFERVVEELDPGRSPARHPLFQVMLSYQRTPDLSTIELPGLRARIAAITTGITKYDLQLTITETSGAMRAEFGYATDLFDDETVAGFARRFTAILAAVITTPGCAVGDLPVLDAVEWADLCPVVSGPAESPATSAALLTAAVERDRAATAVRYRGVDLSYGELDERSNRLARVLIAGGVGAEQVVAVALPRSVEAITAIWAVAKTGAAYLPIDPKYPAARIEAMIADAGVRIGLTGTGHLAALPAEVHWLPIDSSHLEKQCAAVSAAAVAVAELTATPQLDHPAYLIYTSGSTGRPKAVVVTHRGLGCLAIELAQRFGLGAGTRSLHFSSPSFDASVFELLPAFLSGATVIVAPDDVYGGVELTRLLRVERVDCAFITPAALATLAPAGLDNLGVIAVGGDECGPELVAAWASSSRAVFNAYGPTETTVAATVSAAMRAGEQVSIGSPVRGMQMLVLDSRLHPVPVGVPGELYLAGPGVARGYHGRPSLSASRFVADPYALPGAQGLRMYRTGDLVCLDVHRRLRFLGRVDDQVQVRGYRVEVREIDATLLTHPSVTFARTVLHRDDTVGPRLVSYVSVTSPVASAELVAQVRDSLPSYMVPAAVVVLDRIPLTPVGKLDRAALPDPVFTDNTVFRAPATPFEHLIADVFAEVLGVERVGAEDSFFALGGNSLVATRIAARLGAMLGTEVPVRLLFEASTVAALAARLAEHTGTGRLRPPLVAGPRPEFVPLAPAQQRMWFLNQYDTDSAAYNVAIAVRIRGELKVEALRSAIVDVLRRHESLRTRYPEQDGVLVQLIEPTDKVDLELTPTPVPANQVTTAVTEFSTQRVDVTTQVPVRMRLFRVDTGEAPDYLLAVVVHHIAADGFSMTPLVRDITTAYTARSHGKAPSWTPLPIQYADYALWQRTTLGTPEDPRSLSAEQIRYWTETLDGMAEELCLPTDRPRPAVASHRGATTSYALDPELLQALERVAYQGGSSLFMVVHSTLAVLLARLSRTGDIAIGTPIAGRGAAALDDAVGMFVNTLVLRTEIDLGESFTDLLHRVKQIDLDAFANADVPFEQLVTELAPERSRSRHPLFQVMVVFQNLARPKLELPDLDASIVDLPDEVSRFDLQIVLSDNHENTGMTAAFTYATDLFDTATIESFLRRWIRILESVSTDPATPVGDIEILEPAERTALLLHPETPATPPVVLADLLTTAATKNPDATAIVFADQHLTYRELDQRSNQLARVLIHLGAGPESLVAIALPRSIDFVLAIWATAKSGAAFLPLDPTHPTERITHLLTDSGATLGLTLEAYRSRLPGTTGWLILDDPAHLATAASTSPTSITDAERVAPLRPQHPAYLIYTSGTTGVPKGVTVTHSGLTDLTAAHRDALRIESGSRAVHVASPGFDVSVAELLLALGATLVIAPSDIYGGDELGELLDRERISHVLITPSALSTIDHTRWPLTDLRYLVVGGELIGPELVERWCGGRQMFNEYGATEATIVATLTAPLVAGEPVTIGGPIRGVSAWVLDQRLNPVPVGVAGELYIAGAVLARGYHRRAGLTAARFVACPWMPAERMYRTGDVVRRTADGAIQHLGRSDCQVKIRGLRIELGEIDATLAAHDTVGFATTIGHRNGSGTDSLVSYVVAAPGHSIDTAVLTEHVGGRLPSAMVPSAIMVLDHVPLTPVGKLDRAALPDPVFTDNAVFRAPATSLEHTIADLFAEVLGVERVGAEDSFFALGGNSLIATRIAARLAVMVDTEVPARLLFEASTVAALAARLEGHAGTGRHHRALVAGPRPHLVPLAPAQQRMWFLNQYDTDSGAYNVPIAIRIRGELNIEALRSAMVDVLGRHESLRTRYPEHDGMLIQLIEPVDAVDLELTPIPVPRSRLATTITELVTGGFDVSAQVPVRARLFRTDTGETPEYILAVVVHHIAADGFSMTPLARDITTAYTARSHGKAPSWTPLPVQYADYALWRQTILGSPEDPESLSAEQIRYWTETLDGMDEELRLPTDRPRPAVASHRGATINHTLHPELVRDLERLARHCSSSLFMVFHSTLAVLLARLCGVGDIAIGTPVAGRGEAALDHVVGMFVNTLVLRTEIDLAESFTDLLARVERVDLDAFANADVPFEQLVDVLAPERSPSRHPLFQVMLVFQNLDQVNVELPGLDVSVVADRPDEVSRFDLQLVLSDNNEHTGVTASFTYATELFDATTIESFIHRWIRILEALTGDPASPVGAIEILEPAERTELMTYAGAPATTPVVLADLLTAAAAQNPDATAVVFESRHLTYRELDERSNRLARVMIDLGAGPEVVVAVAIPRSADFVIAIWATAKTGAAFLTLDPTHPAERISHTLTDSGATIGLAATFARATLPDDITWWTVDDLDDPTRNAEPITAGERTTPLQPQHPAYLIYTSGSTGTPKGVVVTHTGIADLAIETRQRFGLTPTSRVLAAASPTFDVSILEWLSAAATGATLVLAPPPIVAGTELAELIAAECVTHIALTPTVLASMRPDGLDTVETVVLGGETCPPDLAAHWTPGRTVVNTYGATETTIMACAEARSTTPGREVTIGGPIRGFRAVVLDRRLRPVPPGVVGELYLCGPGLARGYHKQPVTTAARFVPDLYGPAGTRMYRTGDLVTWTAERTLRYRGRSDLQLAIRGHRVEPGDIETALRSHRDIANAAVIVDTRSHDTDQLVGYVVATPGTTLDTTALTAHLTACLPTHMIPTTIHILEQIPVTPSGKLDYKALPAPDPQPSRFRAPSTALEATVCAAFTQTLDIERAGVDDSFFALGGNSLAATRLVARLRASTGSHVAVQWIFTDPTPQSLARRIEAGLVEQDPGEALSILLTLRATGTGAPLFCIHPAIGLAWGFSGLVQHLDPERPVYGLQSPALIDPAARFDTLDQLAARYVQEIRSVQPRGPYHLLGYSLGGTIAHAIAVQLRCAGAQVATLAMMDTHVVTAGSVRPPTPALMDLLTEFGGLDDPQTPAGLTIEAATELLHRRGGLFTVLTPEHLAILHRDYTRLVDLTWKHRPALFDGDLLLFTAIEQEGEGPADTTAMRNHIAGHITNHHIPTRHEHMTDPEALRQIGLAITEHFHSLPAHRGRHSDLTSANRRRS